MRHVRPGRLLAVLLPLLVLTACAANPGDGAEPRRRGGRNLIVEEEIRASTATNLALLIRQARPRWLGGHGTIDTGTSMNVVYLDGVRFGLEGSLEQIDPDEVVRIERLGPADATFRFGHGHGSGAILVFTHGR